MTELKLFSLRDLCIHISELRKIKTAEYISTYMSNGMKFQDLYIIKKTLKIVNPLTNSKDLFYCVKCEETIEHNLQTDTGSFYHSLTHNMNI